MTVGHGISHKHTKYTKYAGHAYLLQHRYYKDFMYRNADCP